MTAAQADLARRQHYGQFYGLSELPPPGAAVLVVHGNCQAEAIRVVIAASTQAVSAVRIPPVHELCADDLPALRRLLSRTAILASQPVGDGYRGLPIGTDELAALAPGAQVVRWPVVRYVGLHPYGALIRTPWRGDPPAVPYHDLRTMAGFARGLAVENRPRGNQDPVAFRAVAQASLDELDRRAASDGLVPVSDLITAAGAGAMHTINHPGNAVLAPLAGRIMAAAGIADAPRDPGRILLPSIVAPVRRDVLAALDLPLARARAHWLVGETEISDDAVARQQYPWYATRPEIIEAALRRCGPAIEALGLLP